MKHPPFYFDRDTRFIDGKAMGEALTERMRLVLLAMCVQRWHSHFVTAATKYDVSEVVKCAKDAARWALRIDRPIWAAGFDKRFCFDDRSVISRIDYVEKHNLRDGLPRRPWDFIRDYHPTFSPR